MTTVFDAQPETAERKRYELEKTPIGMIMHSHGKIGRGGEIEEHARKHNWIGDGNRIGYIIKKKVK